MSRRVKLSKLGEAERGFHSRSVFTLSMIYFRYIPMIAVMGIIFFLSSRPGDSLNLPDIPDLDKILHVLAYGVLGLTIFFAVPEGKYRSNPCRISFMVVLICLLYGISDEFHQSFVPNRMPSVLDLVADTTGALLAAFVWFIMKQQRVRAKG